MSNRTRSTAKKTANAIVIFLAGCAHVGGHCPPGFLVLILLGVLGTIVIVAGMAGGDDQGDE